MRAYDLYGLKVENLEIARTVIEQALGVRLIPHESLYRGEYYQYGEISGEEFILQYNLDPLDEDVSEEEFREYKILFYVDSVERSDVIEKKFTEFFEYIILLRREITS